MMYASAGPGLDPRLFLSPPSAAPRPFPLGSPDVIYRYRARNALYHLFSQLMLRPDETVLVPDYHHGNEIKAILAAGARLRFYRVDRHLQPDLDQVSRLARSGARALLSIHYIGWPQPIRELAEICRERDLVLVEDCALALLSELEGQPLGTFGDFSVFCLYKTLPVPNGAILAQNRWPIPGLAAMPLRPCDRLSTAGRASELLVEWFRSRAGGAGQVLAAAKRATGRLLSATWGPRIPVGDAGFDRSVADIALSDLSRRILERLPYAEIRPRRRANFQLLVQLLDGQAPLLRSTIDDGVCPLFFPLLVPDKAAAAAALEAAGIQTVQFWNVGDPSLTEISPAVRFLREHLLEIPIHQYVTLEVIEHIAKQIRMLGLHRWHADDTHRTRGLRLLAPEAKPA
ncbi:MAG: DegT/DnrJ/EryC1/StrS aminotransferase family protein [Candidatus Schekmanbacteria bacterium]|nr:DegT/DnrJ/EryC1/StrS aminotransferase family protein [Candidatus Schekmanbacteria bacterium]